MAEFYDISAWNEKPWYQTGGTRSKVIVENPETSKIYYFKTSLKKANYDYKYEYWSEIVASEIGTYFGFDMLNYDVAVMKNHASFKEIEIGCLSEFMVIEGISKLTEGIRYLTGFDTTYDPEDKKSKKSYTFQLIRNTLEFFKLKGFIENIIQVIILDSIIGNGDRHQENWGIITYYDDIIDMLQEIAKNEKKSFLHKTLFQILAITSKANRKELFEVSKNLNLPGKFSQIYDSGSCLGRELDDEKVRLMLTNNSMIEAYIRKGLSEIHWEGEKLNHFELIEKINKEYPVFVKKIIQQVESRFNEEEIQNIVMNIDMNLPSNLQSYKLPKERKDLMIKMITLRVQKLIKIIK